MKILEKMMMIQSELSCPKTEFNKFGNYYHRNIETIYEELKPLLKRYKCIYTVKNQGIVFLDKFFRESIGTLSCVETGEAISTSTITQESFGNKGMSAEQCSGSTSSYSDKYLAGKMFLIDDTKDADATNQHDNNQQKITAAEFVFNFGKFKGKKLSEVKKEDQVSYRNYIIKQAEEKNREITGQPLEFVNLTEGLK